MNRPQAALLVMVVVLGGLLIAVQPAGEARESLEESPPTAGSPRGYVCYRTSSPVTIDGKLDDSAWADASWSEAFRDIEGDRCPDPPFRTRMKMLWDDQGLYIAAQMEEPHIWATLRKHDSVIFHDNDFEVFLDPDSDSHLYGELELNALNTTWDLLLSKPYKDKGHAINAWEIAGLRTAVHIDGTLNDPSDTDRGWSVEIFWPWSGIKELSRRPVPPRDGDQWRINFSRVEWDHEVVDGKYQKIPNRREHNWVWSPQGVIDMHRPERWGILQFSTARPGSIEAPTDQAQPARDYLHRIYYAQFAHRKRHGHYHDMLTSLGDAARIDDSRLSKPRLQTMAHGYEASVEFVRPDRKRERWRIMHDGWIGND